ncbi:hypothetical protein B9G79_03650 [Bdellovibrio bacteriovorus]|uniref:Outer membrane protein beta-barrel domain-containing protein n=2 Tax=Bdellovibrio bacteriovorus TaxID=959 RepID=A0A1Z3N5H7_BDEBC|nr:hypothetical protein B9G79_03650 [Bdellovibrio bacteriovorus]
MRVFLSLLFLTLVVSSIQSLAAPTTTTTLETSPLSGEDDPDLASVKVSDFAERKEFMIQTSLGYQSGNYLERDEWTQGPYVALRFAFIKQSPLPVWDYELSYNTEEFLGLGLGHRWYFAEEDRYLPYARLGGNAYLESSDGVTGLIEIRRWRVHAGIGAGETFTGEIGTGFSVTGPDIYAQFGYNFQF